MYNIKKSILSLLLVCMLSPWQPSIAAGVENNFYPNHLLKNFLTSSRSVNRTEFDMQLPKHIEDIMMHGNYIVLEGIAKNEKNDFVKQLAKKAQDRLTNGLRSRNSSDLPTTVNVGVDGLFGLEDLANWEFVAGDLLRSGRIRDWATYIESLRTGPFRSLSNIAGGDIQHFWHLIPVEFTINPSEISDPSMAGSGSNRIPYLEKEKTDEKHIPISIDSKLYDALMDTGNFFGHVPNKYLASMKYKPLGKIFSSDAIGNKSISELIQINKITIGKYVFYNNLFIVDNNVSNIIVGLNSLRLVPAVIFTSSSIDFNPFPVIRCTKRLLVSSNLAGGTAVPIINGEVDDSGPVPLAFDTGNHVDYQIAKPSDIEAAPVTFISSLKSPVGASAFVTTPQGRHMMPVSSGKTVMLSVQDGRSEKEKSLTIYAKDGLFAAYLNDTFLWRNDVFIDFEKGSICISHHR
ncbi:hypothetical protein [Gluconobacter oxydans]|uniref:Uncharacterized protein n=1 Tax=Gluconobacter oxydans NBRC 3293 TaxID=1315969 RepID=A0A829WPA9_GLUOY|nr:hypothetical protein [Gluconobacter oxydans]GEM18450.1 hypothetical protein NBRC3293_2947 [Gluconobacter oxydans NBRC 3293]GEM18608.1 hypothetical protein NBRC3293_3105 [Gluconobacter oxydans NBRC 3293]